MNFPELFQKMRSNFILFYFNFNAPIYIKEDCKRNFSFSFRNLYRFRKDENLHNGCFFGEW